MCYKPITLKKNGVTVPCSKCPKCIARRTSAWSFRLMEEDKQSLSAHFLTLTYDTRFVPISFTGRMVLYKRDLQLFFKRLRKNSSLDKQQKPIKYYAVGEYGGRTYRPHYHIILFNAGLDAISASWQRGHIYFGSVSGASVGYTLKYMSKPRGYKKSLLSAGVTPEFALMSKGLGISYLSETMANWHAADLTRMYLTVSDGKKISMPRYYKDKLYFGLERAAVAAAYSEQINEKLLKKLHASTPKSIRAEQQAIDAAYDKMYLKAQKQLI